MLNRRRARGVALVIKNNRLLVGIHAFNALSAICGGLALMYGTINQPEWVEYTAFTSLYYPGVLLFVVVGGSALIAALSYYKQTNTANLVSLVAGVAMVFWIVGEIVSIRGFHILQLIYVVTGLAVITLTPKVIK